MMKRKHLKEFIYDFSLPINKEDEWRLIEALSRVDGITQIDVGRLDAGVTKASIFHSGQESEIRQVIIDLGFSNLSNSRCW